MMFTVKKKKLALSEKWYEVSNFLKIFLMFLSRNPTIDSYTIHVYYIYMVTKKATYEVPRGLFIVAGH